MEASGVLKGAEGFELGHGPVGALLLHGFTGTPQALRPLGEHLAAAGVRVKAPLLPGHGTTWQDLAPRRAPEWSHAADAGLDELRGSCDEVFVIGLSFGAALGLDLAARRPDDVAGIVTLAGFVWTGDPRSKLAFVLRRVLRSVPGVANDIADPSARELAYDRMPTAAAHEMLRFCARVRSRLGGVRCPALIVHSRNDHTAPPRNAVLIRDGIASEDAELVWLERSYHVITLDYDRDEVCGRTLAFVTSHSRHAL